MEIEVGKWYWIQTGERFDNNVSCRVTRMKVRGQDYNSVVCGSKIYHKNRVIAPVLECDIPYDYMSNLKSKSLWLFKILTFVGVVVSLLYLEKDRILKKLMELM